MYNCITCIKMQKGGGWREMISPITHSFRVHFDGLMLFCVFINSTEMCIFQPKIDFQIQLTTYLTFLRQAANCYIWFFKNILNSVHSERKMRVRK